MEKRIKRGEIYSFDYGVTNGSIQSGKRPVLVLQSEEFNRNATTVIVAAITSVIKKQYLPSHIILPENTGLRQESMVLLEQIKTVNKSELTEYIGFIDDEETWRYINRGIRKVFGLWVYKHDRSGDIRCLCSKCLRDYTGNSSFVVKRLDPFKSDKSKCDKCDGLGYDYIIYDKKVCR